MATRSGGEYFLRHRSDPSCREIMDRIDRWSDRRPDLEVHDYRELFSFFLVPGPVLRPCSRPSLRPRLRSLPWLRLPVALLLLALVPFAALGLRAARSSAAARWRIRGPALLACSSR
jgi:hypothetical protein